MSYFMNVFLNGCLPRPPSPEEIKRELEERERWLQKEVFPHAVDWHNGVKVPKNKRLVIRGESWSPYTLFDVEAGKVSDSTHGLRIHDGESNEDVGYRHVILPRGDGLKLMRGARVYFTTDVVIPVLWFMRPDNVWMSITPMEVLSQRAALRYATRTVLIGGLGMGWMMKQVCAKRTVEKVIVVERKRSLVDWFGQRICDEEPKVELVVGDVFDHIGKHGENAVLLDIWRSIGDARYDRRVIRTKKNHPSLKFWCWGA